MSISVPVRRSSGCFSAEILLPSKIERHCHVQKDDGDRSSKRNPRYNIPDVIAQQRGDRPDRYEKVLEDDAMMLPCKRSMHVGAFQLSKPVVCSMRDVLFRTTFSNRGSTSPYLSACSPTVTVM
jgi:hypothetical protein